MKTLIYTISAAAIVLCGACQNDIDADFSDMSGVLSINAFLYTEHDTNFVYVSETALNNPQPVNNATVEMRVNGTLVETVDKVTPTIKREVYRYGENPAETENTPAHNGAYRLTTRFSEGDVVRIDVYSNGRHAWAEETAPRKIQNPKADFKLANHPTNQYTELTEITFADFTINLPDISPENDYYRISAFADYGYRQTVWAEYGYYYASENTDSICEALRQKGMEVVPVKFTDDDGNEEVVVYCLYKNEDNYWSTAVGINYEYGNDPILSEGEMSKSLTEDGDTDILISDIKNKHKVFTDHFFNNSAAEIQISVGQPFGNVFYPETLYVGGGLERLSDEYLKMSGHTYNMKIRLSLESISENQFYYLKALNVVESENYEDMAMLSGAMKIPSNVNGGSGNICITTNTVLEFTVFDNYDCPRIIDHNSLVYY
ncbi:MAG: DUF4249 family protein [Salinivirgaceae bacterium]|nr:DUF4249 family protein [Salinivirgaceae bacterium]